MKITIAKYYTPSGRCIQKIDYTQEKVEDSLIKKFSTTSGREVVDGRGIYPDVIIDISEQNDFKI